MKKKKFCYDFHNLAFKDGNGFIDRKELALKLRFSAETFTNSEIEVKATNVSVNIYYLVADHYR